MKPRRVTILPQDPPRTFSFEAEAMATAVRVSVGNVDQYRDAAGVYDPKLVEGSATCKLYRQRSGPWILYTGPFWYFAKSEEALQVA